MKLSPRYCAQSWRSPAHSASSRSAHFDSKWIENDPSVVWTLISWLSTNTAPDGRVIPAVSTVYGVGSSDAAAAGIAHAAIASAAALIVAAIFSLSFKPAPLACAQPGGSLRPLEGCADVTVVMACEICNTVMHNSGETARFRDSLCHGMC